MNAKQVVAARKMLGWSATELAERAKVSLSAIEKLERAEDVEKSDHSRVRAALSSGGVSFLAPGNTAPGPGVALRPNYEPQTVRRVRFD